MNIIWAKVILCLLLRWKSYGYKLLTWRIGTLSFHESSEWVKHGRTHLAFSLYQVNRRFRQRLIKTKNEYQKHSVSKPSNKETEEKPHEEIKQNTENQRQCKKHINKSKFLSQDISGISVFPLKQKCEENQIRTQLPSKEFKPKKSLGQNYLKDFNVIQNIVEAVELKIGTENESVILKKNSSKTKQEKLHEIKNKTKQQIKNEKNKCEVKEEIHGADLMQETKFESVCNGGQGVIELGCGLGQMTKLLYKKYTNMTAIEIDGRALSILSRTMPNLDFIHDDVLQVNYRDLSINKNTKLAVVGNLPFYITSQILFCLLDFSTYIEQAIVTIQYEVGKRIIAKPNTKEYSILSILFYLYANSFLLFKIPSKAFYPAPKVEAAAMKIIFKQKKTWTCNLVYLKKILRCAFQQKRKMLKKSLKCLIHKSHTKQIPSQYVTLRPQQLDPNDFVNITNSMFPLEIFPFDPAKNPKVWRKGKHGE